MIRKKAPKKKRFKKLRIAFRMMVVVLAIVATIATALLIFWPNMWSEMTCDKDTHYCVQYRNSSWYE